MNGTNTFVLRAYKNNLPHPFMRKRNVCRIYGYLPSEYDNEDCFEMDMLGFIENVIAEETPNSNRGGKHTRR